MMGRWNTIVLCFLLTMVTIVSMSNGHIVNRQYELDRGEKSEKKIMEETHTSRLLRTEVQGLASNFIKFLKKENVPEKKPWYSLVADKAKSIPNPFKPKKEETKPQGIWRFFSWLREMISKLFKRNNGKSLKKEEKKTSGWWLFGGKSTKKTSTKENKNPEDAETSEKKTDKTKAEKESDETKMKKSDKKSENKKEGMGAERTSSDASDKDRSKADEHKKGFVESDKVEEKTKSDDTKVGGVRPATIVDSTPNDKKTIESVKREKEKSPDSNTPHKNGWLKVRGARKGKQPTVSHGTRVSETFLSYRKKKSTLVKPNGDKEVDDKKTN